VGRKPQFSLHSPASEPNPDEKGEAKQPKTLSRNIWTTNQAYWLLIPGLLLFFVFNLYPIAFSIYLSFTNAWFGNINFRFQFIGLGNYWQLLTSSGTSFYYVLGRTFLFVGTSVPLKVFWGLALAIIFNSQFVFGRRVFRSLLILPWTLPSVLSILAWRGLFNQQFGAINAIFQGIGLPRINWLGNATNAFLAYNVVEVWLAYPFMMTVITAALQSVPPSLYDASRVDGASSWQRLRYVTLPLIWRPMLFATILTSSASFQTFLVPYLLNAGGPANANQMVMVWGYQQAFQNPYVPGLMGLAAAFFVLISLIIIAFMFIGLRAGGITAEA
jgi:arabinogalactan oligomer/maltooligosaccharide transport system permease protein